MKVWILFYSHAHGTDVSVYRTEKKAGAGAIESMDRWFDDLEDLMAERKEAAAALKALLGGRSFKQLVVERRKAALDVSACEETIEEIEAYRVAPDKLEVGDAQGVADFLMKMIRREGTGALFADGVLAVERALPELKGVAVHVKGLEPAGYDPRRLKGMGLGYITTARGACHLRATFYKAELAGFSDPQVIEGKAEVFVDWENRLCIMDTLIYCRFYRDLVPWPYITAVVNAAIGTDYSEADLAKLANRIITETHVFNERRGFGPEKERLPAWITERETEDENKLRITQQELDFMRGEYYGLRGWGVPVA